MHDPTAAPGTTSGRHLGAGPSLAPRPVTAGWGVLLYGSPDHTDTGNPDR